MVTVLFHLALLLVLPPLLPGVIHKTKALFSGRSGPPLFQVYADLARLLRKGMVLSRTTTWIFCAGPVVGVATTVVAGLLVPLGQPAALLGFSGDVVLFAYLFALGRFFTAAAALDTGSSFEGMGAAREVTFSCLAEPVLFFAFLTLARFTGSLRLTEMVGVPLAAAWSGSAPALALLAASLFVVLLAENCRIPFDDPNTHLELTMIHEVMVLDHSGPLFALVQYGAAVKLLVLTAVLVRVAAPVQTGWPWLDRGVFLLGVLAMAVAIGVVESVMARLRLRHVPNLLVAAGVLSGFAFLLLVR